MTPGLIASSLAGLGGNPRVKDAYKRAAPPGPLSSRILLSLAACSLFILSICRLDLVYTAWDRNVAPFVGSYDEDSLRDLLTVDYLANGEQEARWSGRRRGRGFLSGIGRKVSGADEVKLSRDASGKPLDLTRKEGFQLEAPDSISAPSSKQPSLNNQENQESVRVRGEDTEVLRRNGQIFVNQAKEEEDVKEEESCNFADGVWVKDSVVKPVYDEMCPEVNRRWQCKHNGKPNAEDSLHWRWQPRGCNLPRLDAHAFLVHFRNRSIGFIGDSLGRNMYASLVCSLRTADPRATHIGNQTSKTKCIRFPEQNVTLCYYPTNFLIRFSLVPSEDIRSETVVQVEGVKRGLGKVPHMELNLPQTVWAAAPAVHDVLVLNTGHWWFSEEKLKQPVIFSERGKPIVPHISIPTAFSRALRHMLSYIERKSRHRKHIHFFRTLAPHHFEGGTWATGGNCTRTQPLNASEVRDFFFRGPTYMNEQVVLANRRIERAVQKSQSVLLNVTSLSLARADAHPSTYGKGAEDCMHWCLPGVVDVWNDVFTNMLINMLT